jgi:hypothetical protein
MPWSNWKSEDHGIKVLGTPAVASWKEGRLDVFIRTNEKRLYHRVYENEAWQGLTWTNLSDGHPIETAPAAVSWGPNRVDLFAVWDKQVHHRACVNGTWGAWAENLNGVTTDGLAAASHKTLRLDVLVRTSDNLLARRYWESGAIVGWKNWETILGSSQPLTSAPATVATATNRVDCFGRNAAGHLTHGWYQGVIQEQWSEVDILTFRDAPAVVSGTTADRGRVDVFVRGEDDLLKHRVFYSALRRNETPGEQSYTVVQGDTLLKISQRFNIPLDRLKALNPQIPPPEFPIRPGDRIVLSRMESQSTYSDWEPGRQWENIHPANKIASAPTGVAWWSANILKRIDCFAQDVNGNLIHTWWK